MKAKRILIIYLNNGNLQSQVAKEYLFNRVINDLVSEGRVVSHNSATPTGNNREVRFEDGTKVWLKPFGIATAGMRFTHLYIDEVASQLINADEVIDEVYKTCVINGDYMNFDTSDKERIFTFKLMNGELSLKNI